MKRFDSNEFNNEVLVTSSDGVCIITINRPKKMNTMSGNCNAGVLHALELACDDPSVKVVIFTGAGDRAFCAGGNLEGGGARKGMRVKTIQGGIRTLRQGTISSQLLRTMPKITIAAINGAAAGAGLSWACACDIRLAADNAIFKTAFLTAGLAGDFGGTWTLPRIVGPAKAREMYYLNKKVRAKEALRIGLCSAVYPKEKFMEEVLKVAHQLAAAPQLALKRMKASLTDADRLTFPEALDNECERHARSGFHPDAKEAGMAFLQKRKPKFKGIKARAPWELSRL